jgi:hypothetical protein
MLESLPAVGAAGREYEAVSPELVLVDPELARRARRALTAPPLPVSPPTVRPTVRRRSGRLLVVATASMLGCAVALATPWLVPASPERRSEHTATVRSTPTPVARPLRFSWAAVRGAHSYRLVLYRGGTRIYEAVTTVPERTLPLSWKLGAETFRLTRGTYRWVVTPRLGATPPFREGKPIVDASYTF